jgi:hypothetical protein
LRWVLEQLLKYLASGGSNATVLSKVAIAGTVAATHEESCEEHVVLDDIAYR